MALLRGLTTCEALLMGVPVITYPGPSFAGRHSATHLVNAGLAELVADSWEHYRSLAVGLASDLDTLATIRQGLRQQLKNSPVCDAPDLLATSLSSCGPSGNAIAKARSLPR
ncbi:hypothetical protein ACFSVK_04510 [Azorhizophilus paspali]|uniref:O-linked N-acetylglucosamine transferase family protein n=1 Tax=Azorhizophilus paspali TaxID=69963 RepID=UPI00363F39F9